MIQNQEAETRLPVEKLLKLLHKLIILLAFTVTTICCIIQEGFKRKKDKKDIFNCHFDPCGCHSCCSVTQSDELLMNSGAAVPATQNVSISAMSG